ncbi:hypothetical protein SNL152K_2078 [Streptomyces sp. NL15-2K]|nr:hypothetical protein SNL152K_2078 [Streptomyces sp. NL15-2K]
MGLARAEPAAADPAVAARVSLRRQDGADVSETETYRLIWLPAPFLSEEELRAALAPARRGPGTGSVARGGDRSCRR